MTVLKVNNQPNGKTWTGLVNDLFADFDQHFGKNLAQSNYGTHSSHVAVNIQETSDAYLLEFLAPGRKKEDFNLKLEKDNLVVSYEEKKEEVKENENNGLKLLRKEFSLKSFSRTFSLDENIDRETIGAKYEDGILKLRLEKKAPVTPTVKQINIQ